MPSETMKHKDPKLLAAKAARLGSYAIRMTTLAGSGHPSSGLSLTHIATTLLYDQMRWDPKDPWHPNADRLVLSEGHAVPIVYAALADLGAAYGKSSQDAKTLSVADLDKLRTKDSILDGHPNPMLGFPFFDAATGSLGQGLSVAAGLAGAARLDNIPKNIYVLIGDGESREGQVWEAMDFVVDHKLENVHALFNCNGQGQTGAVSDQQTAEMLAKKAAAFGWLTLIVDGHDIPSLQKALDQKGAPGQPVALICKTVKGWGTKALQAKGNHGKPLTKAEMDQGMADLLAEEKKTGQDGGASLAPEKPASRAAKQVFVMKSSLPEPDFEKLLEGDSFLESFKSKKKLGTRRAYGIALRELVKLHPQVVALDGDVSNSTFSETVKKVAPERFFECRIAEQNMVSAAGGFAASGKVPFASTFSKFFSRAMDQIELCFISGHNIKMAGSHAGISIGADGPSQMSVTDMAFFRSFPNDPKVSLPRQTMTVLNPADAVCAYKLVEWMAKHEGLVFLRTMRADLALLYKKEENFEVPGAKLLAEGKDLLICATGYMVHNALGLASKLAEKEIKAGVMDCYSLPAPNSLILDAAKKHNGRILTLEDNYKGGLGSELSEAVAFNGQAKVLSLCVQKVAKSAQTAEEVFDYAGLTQEAMVQAAQSLCRN